MFFIILGIIITIIIITLFVSPTENNNDSNIDWWTIGMISDLHNKAHEKEKNNKGRYF